MKIPRGKFAGIQIMEDTDMPNDRIRFVWPDGRRVEVLLPVEHFNEESR